MMRLKDVSFPSINIKDARKSLRKAEKFLHNLQHVSKSPKAIKDIHKWQRQKDREVKSIVICLEGVLFLLDRFTDIIQRLKKHDKALAQVLIQEIVKKSNPSK